MLTGRTGFAFAGLGQDVITPPQYVPQPLTAADVIQTALPTATQVPWGEWLIIGTVAFLLWSGWRVTKAGARRVGLGERFRRHKKKGELYREAEEKRGFL